MSTLARAYVRLNAGVLFVFLLLSDWLVFGEQLLRVRHALLAAVALVALPYLWRRPRELGRVVQRPPMSFFAAFLAAGLLLAPFALSPASAILHTLVFVGLTLFALAAAGTVPLATTLALVRLALAIKLVASLVLGVLAPGGNRIIAVLANGTLRDRHVFGGLLGNPNPLCGAAAAYLLLAACHLVEHRGRRPKGSRGWLQAGWHAVTIPVAAYLMWQSLSRSAWVGLALIGLFLGLLGTLRAHEGSLSLRQRVWLFGGAAAAATAATLAVLVGLNASRGVAGPAHSAGRTIWQAVATGKVLDSGQRPLFWELAAARIRERPWTGYGMSEAPAVLAPEGFLARERHAHNVVLEAALYAGIPGALLVVLFAATSLKAAAGGFLLRRPFALSVAAVLFFYFLLAQVEPVILGSPYPSLLIVLVLAAHLSGERAGNPRSAGPVSHRHERRASVG